MNADRSVVASFAPTVSFADVVNGRADLAAITELAARGLIRGYAAQGCADRGLPAPCYGPDDIVSRSQMAALIARATPLGPGSPPTTLTPPACVAGSWDCEVWGTDFTDQQGTDPNLWRNAGTLAHYTVARGYRPEDCTALGRVFPCFGPHDEVSYQQTVSFLTRAMVAKGYWANQPGVSHPYLGVSADHEQDVKTYYFYTQGAGGIPAPPGNWAAGATRGWFAQALWQALNTYWGTGGGFAP